MDDNEDLTIFTHLCEISQKDIVAHSVHHQIQQFF